MRLYLLIQPTAMKGQFAARPPGINYRFLRDHAGLVPLGGLHGYTLLAVSHQPLDSCGTSTCRRTSTFLPSGKADG
jgi:hypothetical protein